MVDYDVDKRVGRYLLLGDPIGKGAFGTIYRTRREGGQVGRSLARNCPLSSWNFTDVILDISAISQLRTGCEITLSTSQRLNVSECGQGVNSPLSRDGDISRAFTGLCPRRVSSAETSLTQIKSIGSFDNSC